MQRLYDDSEGSPLFVVEALKSEAPANAPKVHAVIAGRLARLSPPAAALAGTAAAIGRSCTPTRRRGQHHPNGNPTTITRPGGVTLTQTYDADGRLTGTSGTGAESATASRSFGYYADGRLTSAGAPGGTDAYTYDDRGEILSASGPSGSATYTYNSDGLLTSRTDTAGTATFTYNPDGQVDTATDPATGTALTYTYNSTGQVTGIAYGGSGNASRSLGYDAQHRLTSDTLTAPGGATEAATSYDYDDAGHITGQTTPERLRPSGRA